MTAGDYQWVGVEGKKELGGGVDPLNRRDNRRGSPPGYSRRVLPHTPPSGKV